MITLEQMNKLDEIVSTYLELGEKSQIELAIIVDLCNNIEELNERSKNA